MACLLRRLNISCGFAYINTTLTHSAQFWWKHKLPNALVLFSEVSYVLKFCKQNEDSPKEKPVESCSSPALRDLSHKERVICHEEKPLTHISSYSIVFMNSKRGCWWPQSELCEQAIDVFGVYGSAENEQVPEELLTLSNQWIPSSQCWIFFQASAVNIICSLCFPFSCGGEQSWEWFPFVLGHLWCCLVIRFQPSCLCLWW